MKSSCHLPRSRVFCLANGWTAGPTVRCTGATVSATEMGGLLGETIDPCFRVQVDENDVFSFLFVHGSKNQNQH